MPGAPGVSQSAALIRSSVGTQGRTSAGTVFIYAMTWSTCAASNWCRNPGMLAVPLRIEARTASSPFDDTNSASNHGPSVSPLPGCPIGSWQMAQRETNSCCPGASGLLRIRSSSSASSRGSKSVLIISTGSGSTGFDLTGTGTGSWAVATVDKAATPATRIAITCLMLIVVFLPLASDRPGPPMRYRSSAPADRCCHRTRPPSHPSSRGPSPRDSPTGCPRRSERAVLL